MARRNVPKPDVQIDSHFSYDERERGGYVMGEADMEYGEVSGFREGIRTTGMRHRASNLGRVARGGSRRDQDGSDI